MAAAEAEQGCCSEALKRDAAEESCGSDVVEMRPAAGKDRPIVETVLLEPGETFVGGQTFAAGGGGAAAAPLDCKLCRLSFVRATPRAEPGAFADIVITAEVIQTVLALGVVTAVAASASGSDPRTATLALNLANSSGETVPFSSTSRSSMSSSAD